MIRRPPRSTLFPTRRSSDLPRQAAPCASAGPSRRRPTASPKGRDGPARSEEHTSELQSHSDLVCRLLLEKKKKKNKYASPEYQATRYNKRAAEACLRWHHER